MTMASTEAISTYECRINFSFSFLDNNLLDKHYAYVKDFATKIDVNAQVDLKRNLSMISFVFTLCPDENVIYDLIRQMQDTLGSDQGATAMRIVKVSRIESSTNYADYDF